MLVISILKREGLDYGTTINVNLVAIVWIVAAPTNVFENAHSFTGETLIQISREHNTPQYFNGGLSAIEFYFELLKNVVRTIRKFKKFLEEIYKMEWK